MSRTHLGTRAKPQYWRKKMKHWLFVALVAILAATTSLGLTQTLEEQPAPKEIDVQAVPLAPLTFGYEPFVIDGTMLGPICEIAKQTGINLVIQKPYLILADNDKVLKIQIGTDKGWIADKPIKLPFRTFMFYDRLKKQNVMFAPVRFVVESLGQTVDVEKNQLKVGPITWEFSKDKFLAVDLASQHVYAFEGQNLARRFRTCTGKMGHETPPGVFQTYKKVNANHAVKDREWGGHMYKPVYFNDTIALHGSGEMRRHPSSHGCCRLFNRDADWLVKWTPGQVPKTVKGDTYWYIPKKDRITVYVIPI